MNAAEFVMKSLQSSQSSQSFQIVCNYRVSYAGQFGGNLWALNVCCRMKRPEGPSTGDLDHPLLLQKVSLVLEFYGWLVMGCGYALWGLVIQSHCEVSVDKFHCNREHLRPYVLLLSLNNFLTH